MDVDCIFFEVRTEYLYVMQMDSSFQNVNEKMRHNSNQGYVGLQDLMIFRPFNFTSWTLDHEKQLSDKYDIYFCCEVPFLMHGVLT